MTAYPEEFTTITVNLRKELGAIVLAPSDSEAVVILQQVLDTEPSSFTVNYDGFSGVGTIDGIYLHFGGERYQREVGDYTSIDYRGAIKVHLDLSKVSDQALVESLRLLVGRGVRVVEYATLEHFALISARRGF